MTNTLSILAAAEAAATAAPQDTSMTFDSAPLTDTSTAFATDDLRDNETPPEVVIEHAPITRLYLAQELPEYTGPLVLPMIGAGIQSFKDVDRRTMSVAILDGALVKQTSYT